MSGIGYNVDERARQTTGEVHQVGKESMNARNRERWRLCRGKEAGIKITLQANTTGISFLLSTFLS